MPVPDQEEAFIGTPLSQLFDAGMKSARYVGQVGSAGHFGLWGLFALLCENERLTPLTDGLSIQ